LLVLCRIDINLFAAFLLAIVGCLAYLRLDHRDSFNRLYLLGSFMVFAMLLFEAFTCMINHNPSPVLRDLSAVLHMFLFISAPLMTCYWFFLTNSFTRHGDLQKVEILWPLLIPLGVAAVLTFLSPIFGFLFSIDGAGVYHRGPLFYVDMVITYIYLLSGFLVTVKRRKNMSEMDFLFIIIIDLMPMIGGLVQGLVYGVLFIWASSAGALTLMYIYLQERMVQTDSQTGAWTRHSFENSVIQKLKNNNQKTFGIAYADIDNLKSINDDYGHAEGDEAIKATVRIIQSILRKGDAVARLGGDEFAILLELSTQEEIRAVLERIRTAITEYNETSGKKYTLSLSIGADIVGRSTENSVEEIVSRVDQLMYADKRHKKGNAPPADNTGSSPLESTASQTSPMPQ
jgi:diguanylate cyclase (GGDEF)-like protein